MSRRLCSNCENAYMGNEIWCGALAQTVDEDFALDCELFDELPTFSTRAHPPCGLEGDELVDGLERWLKAKTCTLWGINADIKSTDGRHRVATWLAETIGEINREVK